MQYTLMEGDIIEVMQSSYSIEFNVFGWKVNKIQAVALSEGSIYDCIGTCILRLLSKGGYYKDRGY